MAGDKSLLAKKEDQKKQAEILRAEPSFYVSAGLAYLFDPSTAGFSLTIKSWSGFTGWALRFIGTDGFYAIDGAFGIYVPIKVGGLAFVPYGEFGVFVAFGDKVYSPTGGADMGIVLEGGLKFTTAAVPGLYFQAGYHYNLSLWGAISGKDVGDTYDPYSTAYNGPDEYIKAKNYWGHYNSFLMFSVGYAF
ncbi:hypothetical protein FACS1894147_12050 [Spirochaetia bacterium]|nr:hypothetical protein FACS1894147_12050 [Spirochaetia bacterium]